MSVANLETHEHMRELLLPEDILLKVLDHLVDSGLHECRRVCRRWYEACNKLPVKLSLSLDDVPCLNPEQFPNAVSLKLKNEITWNSDVIKNHLPYLTKLSRIITHLELFIMVWPLVHPEPDCPSVFKSVRSLSLSFYNESVFRDFLETLKCLKHLRALKLVDIELTYSDQINMAPITEIKELRELSANVFFLVNEGNQFTFGPQTQLTKLEALGPASVSFFAGVPLQVSNIYAS